MIKQPALDNLAPETAAREQVTLGDSQVSPGVTAIRAPNAERAAAVRSPAQTPMVSQPESATIPLRRSLFRQ
jgi:hypothetical protein